MLQEGLTHTPLQGYFFHLSGFFFTEGVLREGTPLNLCLNYACESLTLRRAFRGVFEVM